MEQFYGLRVCSPTRAALLTGRYPMRHGLQVGVVRPWAQYGLPLAERTLPQALGEAGYTTAICGKWHLGHFQPAYLPTRRGFDHQYGHYNGALDYFTHIRDGGFDWHRDDRVCRDEGYSTFLVAREAARLIREQPEGKPLFLYVPFNAVHAPHQVPAKYTAPYAQLKEPRRTYAGMVAAMDEAIGQIIGALNKKCMHQNTLIIFPNDNGGPNPGRVTSNGPLRAGKVVSIAGLEQVLAALVREPEVEQAPAAVTHMRRVVLYVEDNLSNLQLVERILERVVGTRLLTAMQGGLGLELAREHRPDLILLDLHLPDIEGAEVLRKLREDPRTRDIRTVILTADADPAQARVLTDSGADAVLTKPIDVDELLRIVE